MHEPTRGDNLLDLVLSDLENVSCSVKPKISDHNGVLDTLKLAVPLFSSFKRTVWCYQQADWEQLHSVLEMYDWSFMDTLAVDDSSLQFTETILEAARQAIPQREIVESKWSHPWINDAALALIESKRKAEGTRGEAQARLACSIGLAAERQRYVANLNGTLKTLPRGSKLWWIKSRELMRMQGKH